MPVNLDRRAFVGLGLLCLGGVRAYAADDIDVTGIWSSVSRTGDIGSSGDQMIFTSSNATLTNGILSDSTYTIEDNRITITPNDVRHGMPQICEFKIAGNKMLIRGPGIRPRIMTRTGKVLIGSDQIVGEWSWPFLSEEWRFVQRFSRSGAAQLALPFDMDRGPYRLAGETMHLELVRRGAVTEAVRDITLTVKREGNLLITRDATGAEKRFVKFEYGRLEA
jgi:hypothetical protein